MNRANIFKINHSNNFQKQQYIFIVLHKHLTISFTNQGPNVPILKQRFDLSYACTIKIVHCVKISINSIQVERLDTNKLHFNNKIKGVDNRLDLHHNAAKPRANVQATSQFY